MKDLSNKPSVIMSGIPRDELFKIVRAIKSVALNSDAIAFGSLTASNQQWLLEDLVEELHKEHKAMKKG